MTPEPRLFAVMCTFRRPDDAARSLAALADQAVGVESVVVVDNASDNATRVAVESADLATRYVAPGSNLGPAGGFAMAIDQLPATDDDLVILLDDDDPLPDHPGLVADMIERLQAEIVSAPTTAGIGLRGGVLNTTTGLIKPRPNGAGGIVPADHLHGCAYPLYRVGPLRQIRAFDPALFWGFEELSAGRALSAAGFRLVVAGDLLDSVVDQLPKLAPSRPGRGLAEPSWRHYFRHRNLLRILRRERAWSGIATVVMVRMIGKPVLLFWRHPRLAVWHLRTNFAATIDGVGPESRMGRGADRRPA